MRRADKLIAVILGLMAIFISTGHVASAEQVNGSGEYNSYCNSSLLDQFGPIDRAETVTIEGVQNPLYCTFADYNYALSRAKDISSDALEVISEKYNLGDFTEDNFTGYAQAVNAALSGDEYGELESQLVSLRTFLEIYNDSLRNASILNYLDKLQNSNKLTSDQKFQLGMMLPYYAPLAAEASSQVQLMTNRSRSLPNLSAAVSYAERYAWTPNEEGYGIARTAIFFEADCTNFASQILEASGVGQVVYNDVNLGWWHKKVGNSHTWSSSWINADVFARYMGVGYTTTDHRNFAQNIIVGDFIALDHENNGTWDHMGFVTYQDNAERQYGGRTYRNYIVAQHTNNYNMWVSEDGNNWEFAGEQGGRYGRVRR